MKYHRPFELVKTESLTPVERFVTSTFTFSKGLREILSLTIPEIV
ncbi:MAG: hypothetical protein ACUVT3_00400 [Ignavibacterium sp.]